MAVPGLPVGDRFVGKAIANYDVRSIITMKFNLLAVGQRFELDGETYIKISPLVAEQQKNGQRKLIRKAADVTPTDETRAAQPAPRTDAISAQRLVQALDVYEAALSAQLQEAVMDTLDDQTWRQALAQARRIFLQQLELPDNSASGSETG
jgi:hypothetical protein